MTLRKCTNRAKLDAKSTRTFSPSPPKPAQTSPNQPTTAQTPRLGTIWEDLEGTWKELGRIWVGIYEKRGLKGCVRPR